MGESIVFPNVHFPSASSHAHASADSYLRCSSVSFPIGSNRRHHPLPSIRASVFRCSNNNIPGGVAFSSKDCSQGMNGWYEIELKVREYELDQYGVVSNSVYSSYCQHGHHEIFRRIGIPSYGIGTIDSGEAAVALTDLSLKFISPLKSGDRFVLKVRISKMSTVRVSFQHRIFKLPNHQPIMEANTTGVYVDKNHRPVRIPPEIKSKIVQFIINSFY